MQLESILRNDRVYLNEQVPISFDTCVFCGNQFGNMDFKGKCVCEDCLSFVRELM